jgi:hypothetical protein
MERERDNQGLGFTGFKLEQHLREAVLWLNEAL